jgi:GNAT superfamily N-acetyltransferase
MIFHVEYSVGSGKENLPGFWPRGGQKRSSSLGNLTRGPSVSPELPLFTPTAWLAFLVTAEIFARSAQYRMLPFWAEHRGMEDSPLLLRRATERDLDVITGLIDEAADWLRTKNTDQWAQPWPSEEDRSHRILKDLQAGKSWIVWDKGGSPTATITADTEDSPIWPKETLRDRAVYVSRLVVSRGHAGQGIGAGLLDWAGLRAKSRFGARWVRIDVWTTNTALHAYYRQQGFEFCGFSEAINHRPSAALFQKATDRISPPKRVPFRLSPPDGS